MIDTLKLSLHLVRRNWVVYRKDFIANISPVIADPAFILLALGVGLSPFVQEVNGVSYAQFLAPGLIATTALFTSFFECSYGFYVRLTFEAVFKAMLTTPIGVREVMIGEFIWVFIKGFMMALGVGAVLALFGLMPNLAALFVIPFIGGLIALPCGAIGLISAAMVKNINQFQTVYSFLISPLYFLSGVFFPIDSHPLIYQRLVQISPFYHGIQLMQMTVWGRVDANKVLYHVGALLLFSVVLGAWAIKRIQRKLVS